MNLKQRKKKSINLLTEADQSIEAPLTHPMINENEKLIQKSSNMMISSSNSRALGPTEEDIIQVNYIGMDDDPKNFSQRVESKEQLDTEENLEVATDKMPGTTEINFEVQVEKQEEQIQILKQPQPRDKNLTQLQSNLRNIDMKNDLFPIESQEEFSPSNTQTHGMEHGAALSCSQNNIDYLSSQTSPKNSVFEQSANLFPSSALQGEESETSGYSYQDSEASSNLSLIDLEDDDPEANVTGYLEKYYDTNYKKYEINKEDNYISQKVWNVYYDEMYELMYIFIAQFNIKQGEQVQGLIKSPKLARGSGRVSDMARQFADNLYNKEIEALKVYDSCEVELVLIMQIWNIEDRNIQDKHKRKKPMKQMKVMSTIECIDQSLNQFQIMQYLRNKYQDYAQLITANNQVYFFKDKLNLISYNNEENTINLKPMRVLESSKQCNFRLIPHMRGHNTTNQQMEAIYVLNYVQQLSTNRQEQYKRLNVLLKNKGKSNQTVDSDLNQQMNLVFQSFIQKIQLITLTQDQINQTKEQAGCNHNHGYVGRRKTLKGLLDVRDYTLQSLKIKDEQIILYYESDLECNLITKIFTQRIDDSNSYICLFPTGLLLMLGFNPFNIQSKINLNLKKDVHIVDYSYQVSIDGKNHCIWVLDNKNQVYKVMTEHSPTSGNWTITRVRDYNNLTTKTFFQAATNYDDYYMTNTLNSLKAIKALSLNKLQQMEYLFAFNITTSKCILISQPDVRISGNCNLFQTQHILEGKNQYQYIESTIGMPINQILKNKIRIYVIGKCQSIIMNNIKYKSYTNMRQIVMDTNSDYSNEGVHVKLEQDPFLDIQKSVKNEIEELIYLGKINYIYLNENGDQKRKEYRQFMVRRKLHLEVIYTNGNIFWIEKVHKSDINPPYYIQDIIMSQNKETLIAYCTIPNVDSSCFIKIFKYEKINQKYNLIDNPMQQKSLKSKINIFIQPDGSLMEVQINLFSCKIKGEICGQNIKCQKQKDFLNINIPKPLLFKELLDKENEFERLIFSGDGRVIMCERVIVQLNEDLSKVINVGCIAYHRNHSEITYHFLSLMKIQERDEINRLIKRQITLNHIIKFDFNNIPVFTTYFLDAMYFIKYLDAIDNCSQNGTSVIKMSTKSLKCVEIYQSKFKIINMTINESKQLSKEKTQLISKASKDSITYDVEYIDSKRIKGEKKINNNQVSSSSEQSRVTYNKDDQKKHIQVNIGDFMPDLNGAKLSKQNIGLSNLLLHSRNTNQSQLYKHTSQSQSQSKSSDNFKGPHLEISKQQTINKLKTSLVRMVDDEIDLNSNFLSLLSQSKNQINIEIILDDNLETHNKLHEITNTETSTYKRQRTGMVYEKNQAEEKRKKELGSKLVYYISVLSKVDFFVQSEAGWISNSKIILTINNQYYLINLNNKDLNNIKNIIFYGKQQVNMGLFITIVSTQNTPPAVYDGRKHSIKNLESNKPKLVKLSNIGTGHSELDDYKRRFSEMSKSKSNINSSHSVLQQLNSKQLNKNIPQNQTQRLYKALACIHKMEIASLVRFCFITSQLSKVSNYNKMLLFFTPCEELDGSSIFTKLSANYNVVQKYVDKIDTNFIDHMNLKIRNIFFYIQAKCLKHHPHHQSGTSIQIKKQFSIFDQEQNDNKTVGQMQVHMYQDNIIGVNAINNAFMKNSIFCIKAFVDSLLLLTEDIQFRNCFDQALLLMIKKGMDVKVLCNSGLFYPRIWENYTLFSQIEYPVIVAYNKEIEDLEFENPNMIFNEKLDKKFSQIFDKNVLSRSQKKILKKKQKLMKLNIATDSDTNSEDEDNKNEETIREQYEMQYNYINMKDIQGENKLWISQTLQQSEDLQLFEQEAIQIIIDYKWNTFAKQFFFIKLVGYSIFIVTFIIDLERLNSTTYDLCYQVHDELDVNYENCFRKKDIQFWIQKGICCIIIFIQLIYELIQLKQEGLFRYLTSFWNYIDLIGILIFFMASGMDIVNDRVTNICRVCYVFSLLFSLLKLLYLIRIYRSLSFLTMMIFTVIEDIVPFVTLFALFVVIFSECYQVVQVDISAYGRLNQDETKLFAYFIQTMRSAFGDFSLIDPKEGFDLKDAVTNEYIHEDNIVIFTFVFYILSNAILFMIFMNFIIAVISDSYSKVTEYAEAHDFKQRVEMIYEREIHFTEKDQQNEILFPNILIVRKKKIVSQDEMLTPAGQVKFIKQSFKDFQTNNESIITENIKEQKDFLANSLRVLEHEIQHVNRDMSKIFMEVQKIGTKAYYNMNGENYDGSIGYQSNPSTYSTKIEKGGNDTGTLDESRNQGRSRSVPPTQTKSIKDKSVTFTKNSSFGQSLLQHLGQSTMTNQNLAPQGQNKNNNHPNVPKLKLDGNFPSLASEEKQYYEYSQDQRLSTGALKQLERQSKENQLQFQNQQHNVSPAIKIKDEQYQMDQVQIHQKVDRLEHLVSDHFVHLKKENNTIQSQIEHLISLQLDISNKQQQIQQNQMLMNTQIQQNQIMMNTQQQQQQQVIQNLIENVVNKPKQQQPQQPQQQQPIMASKNILNYIDTQISNTSNHSQKQKGSQKRQQSADLIKGPQQLNNQAFMYYTRGPQQVFTPQNNSPSDNSIQERVFKNRSQSPSLGQFKNRSFPKGPGPLNFREVVKMNTYTNSMQRI